MINFFYLTVNPLIINLNRIHIKQTEQKNPIFANLASDKPDFNEITPAKAEL